MALTINLTLIVQMIHFIGAYLVISRYFLKPGYKAVKEEEERGHQIRTQIIDQQKNVAQRTLYKYQQWKLCQQHFMHTRPKLEQDSLRVEPLVEHKQLDLPSNDELCALAQEVATALKERVLHA